MFLPPSIILPWLIQSQVHIHTSLTYVSSCLIGGHLWLGLRYPLRVPITLLLGEQQTSSGSLMLRKNHKPRNSLINESRSLQNSFTNISMRSVVRQIQYERVKREICDVVELSNSPRLLTKDTTEAFRVPAVSFWARLWGITAKHKLTISINSTAWNILLGSQHIKVHNTVPDPPSGSILIMSYCIKASVFRSRAMGVAGLECEES